MKIKAVILFTMIIAVIIFLDEINKSKSYKLTRVFPGKINKSVTFNAGLLVSPLLDLSQERPRIIVAVDDGNIAALDSETGTLEFQIQIPVPEGQKIQIRSTPITIGNNLVVLYQCIENSQRTSHRLVVIDLENNKINESFPILILSAEKTVDNTGATVKFNPSKAYSHSALAHAAHSDTKLGYVYSSFGNAGDTQPFHGWVFEINMDAWKKNGTEKAISGVLLTTPESECPVTFPYGTREFICGGGIWTPAGPQVYATEDDFELIVPTGNGQIDLARQDYANTLMRLKQGLHFDPECDAQLCAGFNPNNPSLACIESCKNLFIPRLAFGNAPLRPASGDCDDKTFWECLAWMDYDLGANAPVKVELKDGVSVLLQPGKEGGVYLIDADHLGTQYDRMQIVEICGTIDDECKLSWRGMIVTHPVLAYIDEIPIVVIPTFVSDDSHPAGLAALKIVLENGRPKLKQHWQFPDPFSDQAKKSFRSHPGLPVITKLGKDKDDYVWIVEIGGSGTIYGIRVKDGILVAKTSMLGTGIPLTSPLIYGNKLYVSSQASGRKESWLEAYLIEEID